MSEQIDTLLQERDVLYGDAWKISGCTLQSLRLPFTELIRKAPQYVFAWVMILNKLIRACKSPYEIEHWKDIQGYAQLVADDIYDENHKWKETTESVPGSSSSPDS